MIPYYSGMDRSDDECPACIEISRVSRYWIEVMDAWKYDPEHFCKACRYEVDNAEWMLKPVYVGGSLTTPERRCRIVKDDGGNFRVVVEELDGERCTTVLDLDGDDTRECSGWTWPKTVPAWALSAVKRL